MNMMSGSMNPNIDGQVMDEAGTMVISGGEVNPLGCEGDSPEADLQQGVCAGSLKACGDDASWREPTYANLVGYETEEVS